MLRHLHTLRAALMDSFWFIPATMSVAAIALSLFMIELDERADPEELADLWFLLEGSSEGVRAVLQVIAGSMITVAGTVFSITIVAMTLAANQFGPGLLNNFVRDRGNQIVLGTFLSTFIYSLLVLRTVRSLDEVRFVPLASTGLAVILAIISFFVLIYFIHHISTNLQVYTIVRRVYVDLVAAIERDPQENGASSDAADEKAEAEWFGPDSDATYICARRSGYIDSFERKSIMDLADRHDLRVQLIKRPGHFLMEDSAFGVVFPGERVSGEVMDKLHAAVNFAHTRTRTQDAEFAINQLVEVAVRALSTGVNDPFSAMACIDWLGSALCKATTRKEPPIRFRDERGQVRLIQASSSFEGLLDSAFNQIRQNARGIAAITLRLLETINMIAECAKNPQQSAALRKHAELVRESGRHLLSESDRKSVEDRFREAMATLSNGA